MPPNHIDANDQPGMMPNMTDGALSEPQADVRPAPLPPWAPVVALLALTAVAYVPVYRAGYIWDDNDHVTENVTLRSLDGLGRIWTEPRSIPQYYPVTHTTFWAEYQLWGTNPTGYHVVNVLLHAASSVLLWRTLLRVGVPTAWLVAAVFAVHPVHVESVAWISERKNVLSGFFYLSSGLLLLKFLGFRAEHEPATETKRAPWGCYAAALALFVCALLSKSVTGSLPAAVLLVIYWKRGRITARDVALTAPMFVAAIVMGSVTAYLERTHVGATGPQFDFGLLDRVLVAGRAVWHYAWKLLVPYPLVYFYPRWEIDPFDVVQYLFPLAAVALVVTLWVLRPMIGRGSLVAVLFFGGTLLPALGFVNIYPMVYSFVADHFQYLPSIGLLVLFVEGVRLGARRLGRSLSDAQTVVCCLLVVLAALTWRQCYMYKDEETLWKATIAENPRAWSAHARLGQILADRGDYQGAKHHYATSVQINPEYATSRANYGLVLLQLGLVDEALEQFLESTRLDPNYAPGHNGVGVAYGAKRKLPEAAQAFERATTIDPNFADAWFNLGRAREMQNDLPGALNAYREALRIRPDSEPIRASVLRVSK